MSRIPARRVVAGPRVAGLASVAAGSVWVLQWAHVLVTHGATQRNQMETWLGLTWMDSGKLLVLPFLLLIPGIIFVASRTDRTRVLGVATAVVVAVLVAAAAATALQFWTFAWGSYAETFESKGGLAQLGGLLQAFASIALAISLAFFGVIAARAGVLPYWLVAVLVIGSVTSIFLAGPFPPAPGVAWLIFGAWLLLQPRPRRRLAGADAQNHRR